MHLHLTSELNKACYSHSDDSRGSAFADACLIAHCYVLQVKQGGATVGGLAHPATFEAVYDLAGPTYPGDCLTLYVPGSACMLQSQHLRCL